MHDFRRSNADEMFCELLAEKTRYYKENPKGVSGMCKLMEYRVNERNIEIAADLLAMEKLTYEEIAKATRLTIADVEEIAKELKTAKAQ